MPTDSTDPPEAEYERLRAAGVPLLSEPVPQAYVKVCYGRDPDGNLFELLEFCAARQARSIGEPEA